MAQLFVSLEARGGDVFFFYSVFHNYNPYAPIALGFPRWLSGKEVK